MTEPEILIVGAGFGGIAMAVELRKAGVDDFAVLAKGDEIGGTDELRRTVHKFDLRNHIRLRAEVVAVDFDDATDRWRLRTADGRQFGPRAVVLAPGPLSAPRARDRPRRERFGGRSAALSRYLPVPQRLYRDSPGTEIADQHIVGTNGRTLHDARRDGATGFLGIAMHGFPNLFLITGPDTSGDNRPIGAVINVRARYIRRCLDRLRETSSTRIEVRAATQHEFNRRVQSKAGGAERNSDRHPSRYFDEHGIRLAPWQGFSYRRAMRHPDPNHYELTVAADREPAHEYSGPAILDAPGAEVPVTVTLGGHTDPIDGRYHWYGRITPADGSELPDPGRAEVFLTLPARPPTAGRLQERDPWGNLRIVGTGIPPYALDAEIR